MKRAKTVRLITNEEETVVIVERNRTIRAERISMIVGPITTARDGEIGKAAHSIV